MDRMMKNVILIGYMGCGKSTTAVKLSYRMKQSLIDTDKEIEKRQERTIKEIFATQGEEAFRQMETDYLKALLERKGKYILATGGGLPLREENREILKKLGTVIYLRTKPETVYERIKGDTTRPLLQCEDPKAKIAIMLEQRKSAYEGCADYIVDTDELDTGTIVEQIMNHLKAR